MIDLILIGMWYWEQITTLQLFIGLWAWCVVQRIVLSFKYVSLKEKAENV